MKNHMSIFFLETGALPLLFLCGCAMECIDWTKTPKNAVTSHTMMEKADLAVSGEGDDGRRFDTVLAVKAVLEDGFPINHAVNADGQTLLSLAVLYQDARLVRFLLNAGADKSLRCPYGWRPIDIAMDNGNTQICRLLAVKSGPVDVLVAGIPEGALEAFFRKCAYTNDCARLIMSVNKERPSGVFSNWIASCSLAMEYRMGTYVERLAPDTGEKEWRWSEDTSLHAGICHLTFERVSKNRFNVLETGGDASMCNYYARYEIEKKYGYWFCDWIESGTISRTLKE